MTPPSVTLIFPKDGFRGCFGPDIEEIRRAAGLILHTADPHCYGWNAANLMRRLSKLLPSRTCILVLFVTKSLSTGTCSFVAFGDGANIPLSEVLRYVGRRNFSPTYLFLILDECLCEVDLQDSFRELTDSQFVTWSNSGRSREVVSLACEFAKWWDLRSLNDTSVSQTYLAERLIVLIGRLNNLFGELPCIQFLDRMRRNAIAWSGGRLVVKDVDYENFAPGIRVEHFADTLKRLADAAYAPRAQHLRPQQCLASSQAIFWFTELPQGAIDFDWLSATRFSFELFGGAVAGRAPDIQFAPRQNVAESLVRDFLDSFVEVPAGTYLLGSETEAKISEPPAERVSASIRGFRILKRPVTGTDWQLFSTTSLGTGSSELLPVTQCTAFQAFLFAKQVEEVLRRFNFIADCERVLLPSEQQWEAAARGPQAYEYPWGNVFQELHCNCDQKFGLMPTVPGRFSPAGDSPFGCQDMAGNVREWTRSYGGISGVDWRKNSEVPLLRTFERLRPTDRLIIRGGSYSYEFDCVRTWVRNTQLAERKDLQTGFRIVIDRLPA